MNKRISPYPIAFLLCIVALIFTGWRMANSATAHGEAPATNPETFTWTMVSSPVMATLHSIDMISTSDGWAVGENGSLLRFDGEGWGVYSLPATPNFTSVSMSSESNGWALGDGNLLYRWNGAGWDQAAAPSPPWPFHMVDISAPDDTTAWAAGGVFICSAGPPCVPSDATGTLSDWNGTTWTHTSISHVFFSSIAMISKTDGWAVGTEVVQPGKQMRSAIFHWNGSSWSSVVHPTFEYPAGIYHPILEEVSALDANTAWAAITGQKTFLKWNGAAWTQENSPVEGKPSIVAVTPAEAWAVGGAGIISLWNGEKWTWVTSPVTTTLTSVAVVNTNDAWAVGTSGVILHGVRYQAHLPIVSK